MDSPLVSSLFRSLFRQRACLRPARNGAVLAHRRHITFPVAPDSSKDLWQPRSTFLQRDRSEEFGRYPMVTAKMLATRKERPKRVKMLVRDFIDDSLYNPHYGYFSKAAVIFSTPTPFPFTELADEAAFQTLLGARYTAFEDALDAAAPSDTRQLWHTPTELFKPHYGEAISRYLVANYKLTLFPYSDLIIYELGAGNGTMMNNILDHIRATDPDVYARTKYRVIEISDRLAGLQRAHVAQTTHADKIEIVNKSIFDWTTYVPDPCFFLALEVADNFPHDMIRYDSDDRPLQGHVMVDVNGDFFEFYSPLLDPVVERFLRIRQRVARPRAAQPWRIPGLLLRRLRERLPLAPNLSQPEFVPTAMMALFDVLRDCFPAHRLLMSDFHALPDAVEGVNAPVVQTRYKRTSIPVSTPFVHQGLFDILFPTDFEVMDDMYKALTGKLTRVMKQEEFLKSWAFLEETETTSGDNPMLNWYKNASVMSSV
ncbi:hypothetical protein Q9L58_007880 [Maublancomyces gigas]|uniref:Protein arginine methyltransferase NDUFAF7 n=1 Tax=Discina gigas TaxID=1032678 RepID=A0ABR3GBL8_9PEZI